MILPDLFPPEELREYCRGFANVLASRADLEGRNRAKYLANQQRSFRQESSVPSWTVVVVLVGLGLVCLRSSGTSRPLNIILGCAIVGVPSFLLGEAEVLLADPARMCAPSAPVTEEWDWYEDRFLPPRATCHWNDGRTEDLVSPWITPAFLIGFGLIAVCLVTLAVTHHRKGHQI
ncbi:hypothetical protein OG410_25325 [Streptomyces sp. NBC_00659]|uniref:hypothetical protein n=1 Tax=Streptomyces sp. NBC_00659 TaxID=2903669 RepID=UPI002E34CDC0|nr:hypothetical protein [Streptomyces sp. NBC_00659]